MHQHMSISAHGPSLIDAAVEGALERLAGEHQRSFERAETKGERSFFTRWAGAFRKALLYYHQGIRPEPLASGAWLVASATRGGVVHQVDRQNHCSCEARDKGCWHAALCLGIEVAGDDLERFDDPIEDATDSGDEGRCMQCGAYLDAPERGCPFCTRRLTVGAYLGRRLALARAELLADELYGRKAA